MKNVKSSSMLIHCSFSCAILELNLVRHVDAIELVLRKANDQAFLSIASAF